MFDGAHNVSVIDSFHYKTRVTLLFDSSLDIEIGLPAFSHAVCCVHQLAQPESVAAMRESRQPHSRNSPVRAVCRSVDGKGLHSKKDIILPAGRQTCENKIIFKVESVNGWGQWV